LGAQLAGALRVADRPFQLGEVVQEELAHLGFQLGETAGVARAGDRRGLHLQHRHVVGGPTLLAIDVLQAGGGPDVGRVPIDRVDQVGLGALRVPQLVQPQLRRQIEELCGLGVVLDGLGARLVERDQPVVLLRLPIGFPERDERLGVGWIPLEGGFVFPDGRHARDPKRRSEGEGGRSKGRFESGTLPRPTGRNQAVQNLQNPRIETRLFDDAARETPQMRANESHPALRRAGVRAAVAGRGAGVAGGAVGRAGAAAGAGGVGAGLGCAVAGRAGHALARAVALGQADQGGRAGHAGRRRAGGSSRVVGALAGAVAGPGGSAGAGGRGGAGAAGGPGGHRGAAAGAVDVAGVAGAAGGAAAADAVRAHRAQALGGAGAGGAQRLEVGADARLAGVAGDAVAVRRAAGEAGGAAAHQVSGAGLRRLHAGARAVAGAGRGAGRAGAAGGPAAGAGAGGPAGARAVAGAVEPAGRGGGAAMVRFGGARGHGLARAGVAGQVADLAGAAAGGRATDAVDAVGAVALGVGGADLAQALEPARAVGVAELAGRAVGVAGADRDTGLGGGVAGERVALLRGGRLALAGAVAGRRQCAGRRAGGAAGLGALGAGRIDGAGAAAVAEAGGAAAARALVGALAGRIGGAGRDRAAGPLGRGERAGHAGPGAGGGAANALGALARQAFGTGLADGAVGLEAAGSAAAGGGR